VAYTDRLRVAPPPPSKPFPEVYRTYFVFVWRTLGRMHVREADLLDLTQNVFVIVHRQLPGFEGRSELTTWLYSICRRVARDYLRSAPVRREVLVDTCEAGRHGALREEAAQRFDSTERSQLLDSILIKIPEKLREVFVFFELDELSGDEIARLLDIPVGTVRSRLRLARAAFQRHVSSLKGTPDELHPGGADGRVDSAPADLEAETARTTACAS
jgi:RNA polymerase sigma-70 factor, ECF subfamily